MHSTVHSRPTEYDQVEELRSAISSYKSIIKKVENSKLKNLNKTFQENMRKKINSREDIRLHHSKNLILPSITTLNLNNFYEFLLRISKVHKVSLNIIPTLFLPKPATFLFTNLYGQVQSYDGPKAFDQFFQFVKKNKRPSNTPICLFKGENKKITLFQDEDQTKLFVKQHKALTGIIQEFVLSPSDRTSVCKVLWKANKFKYLMVINKHPYKENPRQKKRPATCTEGINKMRSDESMALYEVILKKERESKADELLKQKLMNTPGILNRIQAKVQNPWKQQSSLKFSMDPEETDKFIINGVNLDDCCVDSMTTSYPEIEKMMSVTSAFLKKFKLHEKVEISELVCEFLKDSNKTWRILNTPLIKLYNTDFQEILHKGSSYYYNLKLECESEAEGFDDTTIRYDEKSEKTLPAKNLAQQFSMKSQFSFKPETNSFQDKFRKTIKKIDRIRKRDKINANVGLDYELIQNYRAKLNIDRNGNVDRLMLIHSPEKPFEQKFDKNFNKDSRRASLIDLHSGSKQYDRFNATSTVAMYTQQTVENYESIITKIRKKKFSTMKLDDKYGGLKFILNFTQTIIAKVSQTPLCKYLRINEENEQVFCPGLKMVFDCKVNLALAKRLHMKHVDLRISKEDYEIFTEVFMACVKEFEFCQQDCEYLSALLMELSRDVYVKKIRKETGVI